MGLAGQWLIFLLSLGGALAICVFDNKKGWKIDCGLRDSYLFRIKDFGGLHANFDVGFGLGDEKGFKHSISKSNYKAKAGKYPPQKTHREPQTSYSTNHVSNPTYPVGQPSYSSNHISQPNYSGSQSSYSSNHYSQPTNSGHSSYDTQPAAYSSQSTYASSSNLPYQHSPYRRNQNQRMGRPVRVNDFPYNYEIPANRRGFFSRRTPKRNSNRRPARRRIDPRFQPSRFQSAPSNYLVPPPPPPLPPPFGSRRTGGFNQHQSFAHTQNSIFRVITTTTTTAKPVPTLGPSLGELLQLPAHTKANSDNVPSFAAKMFIIREAPKEFYPPGYRDTNPHRTKFHVQIPRTKFYCEEQKFLPGIYSDSQLGCKMFHLCVPSAVGSSLTSYLCPNGTLFDQSILQCNHWYNVNCPTSIADYDANKALSLSYRRINAAHLPLHAATDSTMLSLLSQDELHGSTRGIPTQRMGRMINFVEHEVQKEADLSSDNTVVNIELDKKDNR